MSIVVKTHPLMEIIAKKLSGISGVPKEEQEKMVVRAAKAAAEYHDEVTDWLLWFYQEADFGPASSDVRSFLKSRYKRTTGKELPKGFDNEEE